MQRGSSMRGERTFNFDSVYSPSRAFLFGKSTHPNIERPFRLHCCIHNPPVFFHIFSPRRTMGRVLQTRMATSRSIFISDTRLDHLGLKLKHISRSSSIYLGFEITTGAMTLNRDPKCCRPEFITKATTLNPDPKCCSPTIRSTRRHGRLPNAFFQCLCHSKSRLPSARDGVDGYLLLLSTLKKKSDR